MKVFLLPLALSLTLAGTSAQEASDQAMLEKLFGDHESLASLQSALKEAGEKELPKQTLDEALFLYHIRSETAEELAKYIGRFEQGLANYRSEDAVITNTADEWRALVTFCKAMQAAKQSDLAGFKKQITEAFWLSPANAEIFAAPILKVRNQEAMAKLVVDFEIGLLDTDGNKTSLAPHIKDRKAILIDFWASWCEPCMELMPQLQASISISPSLRLRRRT